MRPKLKEEISIIEKQLEKKLKEIDKRIQKRMRLAFIIAGFIIIVIHYYLYNIYTFD